MLQGVPPFLIQIYERRKTMGLFNRKPKAEETPKPQKAEDIMKLIESLPEDEFDKLSDMLLADENENGKPDTMEQVEKAEENIEAEGEDTQTEEDRVDESVAEQEKDEGDEDSQDAKDRVDEAEGKEKYLSRKDVEALLDEILPSRVEKLLKAHKDAEDEKEPKDDVDEKTKSELSKIESIYNN